MTTNFQVEYSNAGTNWQWTPAPYLPTEESGNFYNGMFFNDAHIVPDYSPIKPFFSWTNFRIKCNINLEKINIIPAIHTYPNNLDSNGLVLQKGDASETLDRFFIWIKATNKSASYSMTNSLFDPVMAQHASTSDYNIYLPTISDQGNNVSTEQKIIEDISSVLGWNPVSNPRGTGNSNAWNVELWSSPADICRWVVGWHNTCCNQPAIGYNPLGAGPVRAIADAYRMIEGVVETGHVWLGCGATKYIYGKAIYSLEGSDFINHDLLRISGWRSFGLEATGLHYA